MINTKFRIVHGMGDEVGHGLERAHRWMQVMLVVLFLAWVVGTGVFIRLLKY